ncbi:hypothetical protein PENTCL1PPCAC_11037, partial [Pristionchus entomophagus]
SQDQSNMESCKQCPDGTITVSEGATKITDCYQNCEPGNECNFDVGVGPDGAINPCCQPCGYGRYASGTGTLQCQDCKYGMTTKEDQSTTEKDCYWPCIKGEEMNEITRQCKPCDKGMYKDSDQVGQCVGCKTGLTTAGTGSKSASDCSVLYCPINTYVNPGQKGSPNPDTFKLDDFCLPCEKGTWQPLPNSKTCDKCPDTPSTNVELPSTCRLENECSPQLEKTGCAEGMKCIAYPDNKNYYHCVEDHSEQQEGGSSLVWWQIVLIVAGSCLGVAAVVAIAVIVAMRCCNFGKKPAKDTDSFSQERRTTGDNFNSTVADKEERLDPLPTPGFEMPAVYIDPSYVYNKPPSVPPTPMAEQLPIEYQRQSNVEHPPIEYQRQSVVKTASVVRMRKRMSNASATRQSRPFSNESVSSVPSIRNPAGRSSGNYFVPSVTIRSNSESSLGSFSVRSTSSRQSDYRPRMRPDSTQIVHALIDALDEDRFRGGWDRESSIL